ncbi:MAG: hypothetical protein HY265_07735 [Deltaproteobacteria bacterium]|nr:hypothetical protein [Deltaproteobacteria bacterium]
MQVAATIIGIEGATGKKYENAELRYRDGTYKLDDLERMKVKAINIIEYMRRYLANQIVPKGKPTVNKCRVCDFRLECLQSMTEPSHA